MAQLSSLIDAIEDPALWVSADRRVGAANGPARELFGAAVNGVLARAVLRQPDCVAALDAGFAALAAPNPDPVSGPEPQVFRAEMLDLRQSDDVRWAVRVRPVRLPVPGLLVTLRDQGQIVAAEQQRRDFVANVSHELRSPLTALTGFIETLRGPARDDAVARARFLDIMDREAARMNRLVDDLLSLSRVEVEQRVRPRAELELVTVLRAVMASLAPQVEAAGARIETRGLEAPVTLRGDRDQLIQVFHNLIENALKYGKTGGEITLTLERRNAASGVAGPVVEVAVQDQGEGIDTHHLPRLTERFYRVDSHRSREQGGTGLGLAIVKHIVQRHRGRLAIRSVKGQGSRFAVILPLA